jgi:hypothetical protein
MITQLTSELNRINQGCKKRFDFTGNGFGYNRPWCCEQYLCPTCQKEKETLKKVSIMWADEMIKDKQNLLTFFIVTRYKPEQEQTEEELNELQQIKSLMEKE